MKILALALCLSILGCNQQTDKSPSEPTIKWTINQDIKTPESIYYDADSDKVFVSSIDGEGTDKDGKGHISTLSKDGKVLNSMWVSGLNAPKGMRAANGKLWVSDIDEIVEIDIATAKVLNKYKVEGAKFLNDIAIDGSDVYVSDTLTSKIHLLKDAQVSTFVEGDEYESPNGLLIIGRDMYVAAWGLTTDWNTKVDGRLYKINLDSKEVTYIIDKPLGHLDGLEQDKNSNFIVSDWSAGVVYKITPKGEISTIFKGKEGLADIGWIAALEMILIPYMKDNQVFAL
jgi:DNA-binding beta-propeller fold protein YncE